MHDDVMVSIGPPGALRRLLEDKKMRGQVIVSELHRCSSYARYLTDEQGGSIALGLNVQPPVAVAEASSQISWERVVATGNFKCNSTKRGLRPFFPLYRLVSLVENGPSTGLRHLNDEDPPLPDAIPPWLDDEDLNLKVESSHSYCYLPR